MIDRETLLHRRALLAALASLAGAAPALAKQPPVRASNIFWDVGPAERMHGFMALPAAARGRQPAVIVVHDAAGLDDATRQVAWEIARAGYIALAPDFGTPADPPQTLYRAQLTLHWLRYHRYTTGRIAAIGFGWGADLAQRLAAVSGDQLAVVLDGRAGLADAAAWAATLRTLKESLG